MMNRIFVGVKEGILESLQSLLPPPTPHDSTGQPIVPPTRPTFDSIIVVFLLLFFSVSFFFFNHTKQSGHNLKGSRTAGDQFQTGAK